MAMKNTDALPLMLTFKVGPGLKSLALLFSLIILAVLMSGCVTQSSVDVQPEPVAREAGSTQAAVGKVPPMQEIKSHIIKKEFAQAEAKLRLHLSRDKNNPIVLANLGVVLSENGRVEEAVKMLRKAVEINEDLVPAYARLASIARQQGNINEAVSLNQKALDINPDYANAHYNLAILYVLYMQQPEQALSHLESYIALIKKEDKRDLNWKKQLLRKIKSSRASEAGKHQQKSVDESPVNTVANNK